ncbi:MAG: glycosyltransferase family 9 protein [Acidobacteriia bacterium]|nr:glycosyltransferase family 9 protein [Terriglobia bacterium]
MPNSISHAERMRALRLQLEHIPRLLIIRLRSLGDSILALPLLEALHAWRPDLQIDVLVEAQYAAVFSRHPAVHETLILRPRKVPEGEGWPRIRTCLEICRRRYSAVVNLHGGTTSSLFTLASCAGLRIGQEKYRQGWVYNALIPNPQVVWQRSDLHTVEDQLTLLRWLDLPIPARPRGKLFLDDGVRARIRERLVSSGIGSSGYLVIHPTATLPSKQWKEEKFAGLADRLHERYALPVIFTAGLREAQVLLDIGRNAHYAHRYWSDLGLDELFSLIEGCRLFIGNDSGPTHAAAALGRPLVVVWGSSDYRDWHPWETEYESVGLELPCMPCPGYTCTAFGTPRCIDDIPVELVMDACDRFLKRGVMGHE